MPESEDLEVEEETPADVKGAAAEGSEPTASQPDSSTRPTADDATSAQADDQRTRTQIRKGVFVWGCIFLGLAAVDAIFDPLPASELFLGGTGTTLVLGAITDRMRKDAD